jgi:YbbR domain-containing protein
LPGSLERVEMGSGTIFDKIIAIVVALILWVYVVNVVNPLSSTTIQAVPVQLLNQEVLAASNLAIAGTDNYTVDIVLEGARSDIITIDPKEITATADLFGFSKGQNYLVVNVSVPEKITVVEIRSARIQVFIDELVSISKPVSLLIEDAEKEYEIGGITVNPESVNVSGAKSIVDKVQSVQVKISENQLVEKPSTIQLSAEAIDSDGSPVIGVRLSNVYIELTGSLYEKKTVPLEVPVEGVPAQEMELISKDIPQTITIKGSKEALSAIDAIVAQPLRIQGITEDVTLSVVPVLPEGIEVAEESVNLTASFILVSVAEVSFEYGPEDVWIFNIPSGYSVEVLSRDVTVTARGEEAVVNALQATDLQPAINARLLSAGEHDVQIDARYEQQLVRVSIFPATVRVKVTVTDTSDSGGE